ncbi:MAG: isoprenylcysteine carboxylmethyltransferase family protein [Acidobacteria bacterium]|nr:isoprenylcysteine carboxylmethyltransferase family protein [Acidobacteriota bacterium]MDA1235593.1 isoprenylcysteine carboxylmethyltransferase family protein [Acidobacteriota bacterium]
MQRNVWLGLIGQYAAMALLLFLGAGTVNWPEAWAFLTIYAGSVTAMSLRLAQLDPGLLQERVKVTAQLEQPLWDRVLLKGLGILILVWLIVPGIDAVRFEWSNVSPWLKAAGAVITAVSLIAIYAVMRQNSYLAPTVKVQRERGHRVISTGAYGMVRHPFYALLIPFFASAALLLGSWWGVFASGLIGILLAFRCIREERHLCRALEGYADYLSEVRSRLIPYVW